MCRTFLLIYIVSLFTIVRGQEIDPVNFEVIPPTPQALSMIKFGSIPVNLYSGIQNIDIPIYTYKGKQLSLPISLKYHAGGIRVEEIASNVGLGWSLSAGGVVSRTVRGLIDDMDDYGYLALPAIEPCPNNPLDPNFSLENLPCYDYYRGAKDSQQDLFNVSLPSLSFSFVISKDTIIILNPPTKVRVVPKFGTLDHNDSYGSITGWKIIDENGIIYHFDSQEYTKSESSNSNLHYWQNKYIVSSWYLSRIETPFTEEQILFSYTNSYTHYNLNVSEVLSLSFSPPDYYKKTTTSISTIGKRLNNIYCKDATIHFTYDISGYRYDLVGDKALQSIQISNGNNFNKSWNFDYQYWNGSTFENYYTVPYDSSSNVYIRLILESITEEGTKPYEFDYIPGLPSRLSNSQDHWGFYNGKENETLIPKIYSIDALGNIMERGEADRSVDSILCQAGTLNNITYPAGGKTKFEYESNKAINTNLYLPQEAFTILLDGIEHKDSLIYIERHRVPYTTFLFKLIDFPSNFIDNACGLKFMIKDGSTIHSSVSFLVGDTSFIQSEQLALEENKDYLLCFSIIRPDLIEGDIEDPFIFHLKYINEVNVVSEKVGGIRISRITDFVDDTDSLKVTEYFYEHETLEGESSGFLLHKPEYTANFPASYPLIENSPMLNYWGPVSSTSQNFLGTTQGSSVGYQHVIEKIAGLGETEYTYTSPRDFPDLYSNGSNLEIFNNYPWVPPSSFENLRGLLKTKKVYNMNNDLIQYVINDYYYKWDWDDSTISSLIVGIDEAYVGINPNPVYLDRDYEILIARSDLKSTTQTNFFTGDSIVQKTEYEYDPTYYTIKSKFSYQSNMDTIVTKYYYPQDYSSANGEIYKLFENNIFQQQIAVDVWNGVNNPVLINSQVKNYEEQLDEDIFLNEVFQLNSVNPLSIQEIGAFNPNLPVRDTTKYIRVVKIFDYDEMGNPLTIQFKDKIVSYVWDSDDIHPIASATNASSSEIFHNNFEYNLGSYNVTDPHSGHYSYQVLPNSFSPGHDFGVWDDPVSEKYIFSAWVKTPSNYDNSEGILIVEVRDGDNFSSILHWQSCLTGNTANQWKHFSTQLDLGAVAALNPGKRLNVRVFVKNTDPNNSLLVDDLRFYPKDSQMTTYTYDPLIGMTSQCDPNGISTYYEYDDFGRLKSMKDNDGNLLKEFEYHYREQ